MLSHRKSKSAAQLHADSQESWPTEQQAYHLLSLSGRGASSQARPYSCRSTRAMPACKGYAQGLRGRAARKACMCSQALLQVWRAEVLLGDERRLVAIKMVREGCSFALVHAMRQLSSVSAGEPGQRRAHAHGKPSIAAQQVYRSQSADGCVHTGQGHAGGPDPAQHEAPQHRAHAHLLPCRRAQARQRPGACVCTQRRCRQASQIAQAGQQRQQRVAVVEWQPARGHSLRLHAAAGQQRTGAFPPCVLACLQRPAPGYTASACARLSDHCCEQATTSAPDASHQQPTDDAQHASPPAQHEVDFDAMPSKPAKDWLWMVLPCAESSLADVVHTAYPKVCLRNDSYLLVMSREQH